MSQKILVIEDEEALRVALSDRLKNEGYAVECAADGEDGFQKALHERFDLILLDVMLPRKKGFDICRDVRSAGIVVPIIMLTARGETVDKVLAITFGDKTVALHVRRGIAEFVPDLGKYYRKSDITLAMGGAQWAVTIGNGQA